MGVQAPLISSKDPLPWRLQPVEKRRKRGGKNHQGRAGSMTRKKSTTNERRPEGVGWGPLVWGLGGGKREEGIEERIKERVGIGGEGDRGKKKSTKLSNSL